jgi:hypothetical protein
MDRQKERAAPQGPPVREVDVKKKPQAAPPPGRSGPIKGGGVDRPSAVSDTPFSASKDDRV